MSEPTEHLLLKWGTVKAWHLNEDGPAFAALKRYAEGGMSAGAAQQHDTPDQKAALCDVIDAVDGPIKNDWSGEVMTKDQAKAYVMEYRA